MELGYWLSSEEHPPGDLVRFAQQAEAAGFSFALISDHYHPWLSRQGHAPFVWSVVGAIAQATGRLRLGTGVTCPLLRLHPAIVAQAAATAAAMMPGRFFLGVGSGENLNEHIVGEGWPVVEVRQQMLAEAIAVIRRLWQGEPVTHEGTHYAVEDARLFTLPEEPPPLFVAAAGTGSAELAGRLGDGLISVGPNEAVVEAFAGAGGSGKPRIAKVAVCWAEDEATAQRIVTRIWPLPALPGALMPDLHTAERFEQAVRLASAEEVTAGFGALGPNPAAHLAAIREVAEAGFEQVVVHQVGPDQAGFFNFYRQEVLPRL